MQVSERSRVILLADDDPDDREMICNALEKNRMGSNFYSVEDGEELMDFLHHRGQYAPPAASPTPDLIFLDLNMPRKDGREALAEIKSDTMLRRIPILVMTTSKAEEDIRRSYDLGASSFICKPISLPGLTDVMRAIGHYWFQLVQLPAT